jgi:hypothetical protein
LPVAGRGRAQVANGHARPPAVSNRGRSVARNARAPSHDFWSLTLYNEHHFFAPNEFKRYSLGTKNKTLKMNPDGSLTFYVQADAPPEAQRDNWLPAPKNADFSLFMRAYWPKAAVLDGSWTPPAVARVS